MVKLSAETGDRDGRNQPQRIKSREAGAKRTGQAAKLGETSGGTDFLLARTGGDFKPSPSHRPRGVTGNVLQGDDVGDLARKPAHQM